MEFGLFVRERRRSLDLTQAALATRVHCSVDTIKSIETRGARPSRELAALLATKLEIPFAERAAFVQWARSPATTPEPGALTLHPPNASANDPSVAPATSRTAYLRPIRPIGPRTNLPFYPTPLVGREAEIAAVRHLLWNAGVRLLTLTGPPGTGKTRLAVQATAGLVDDCADGVWFVPLAPIRDPDLVASAVAGVLGIQEVVGQPLNLTLAQVLRDKNTLLVLDNFEQILDAGLLISALLAATARLKVLITSRVVVHLYGEHDFPVPPLRVPDAAVQLDVAHLAEYEAVALFQQQAVAVSHGFTLTNENGPAVAEICRHLDGLPLAIELAAAQVRLLPPSTILARLADRFALLAEGPRDVSARQQTLQGAIDWSYNLLAPVQQELFRRMSVFRGSCTLEAIAAVCNCAGDPGGDVREGVMALLDASLLQQVEGREGEPRFVMLETIHEYAWEQLEDSGEGSLLGERHLAYFLALAEMAALELQGPRQAQWLISLEEEHDNLRAALDWAAARGAAAAGQRLAWGIWRFWEMRGHWSEGRARLQQVLAATTKSGTSWAGVRARALAAAAWLAFRQADLAESRARAAESLALARVAGDRLAEIWALCGLGGIAFHFEADYNTAQKLAEEALALSRAIGDEWCSALMLSGLGIAMHAQGDEDGARTPLQESVGRFRALGEQWGLTMALSNLGVTVAAQGDDEAAYALFEEALALARALSDPLGIALALLRMGRVATRQGNYEQAEEFYTESLALSRELGQWHEVGYVLNDLGMVATLQGKYEQARALLAENLALFRGALGDQQSLAGALGALGAVVAGAAGQADAAILKRAAQVLGAVAALLDSTGDELEPDNHLAYERAVNGVRAALGAGVFAEAWTEGQAQGLDAATALANEG